MGVEIEVKVLRVGDARVHHLQPRVPAWPFPAKQPAF